MHVLTPRGLIELLSQSARQQGERLFLIGCEIWRKDGIGEGEVQLMRRSGVGSEVKCGGH
jgi:hypothetical protein